MTAKDHTFRELIYLGHVNAFPAFAAESDSLRLAGRGGMGYLVSVDLFGSHCNCPALDGCWHAREAPVALSYWQKRLGFAEKTREDFDTFWAQWWPKHDAITERCRAAGEFKGKSEQEWTLFFSALLDEYNARSVAYGKVERAFGKDLLDAVLGVQREETE